MIRNPVVQGHFYPADAESLAKDMKELIRPSGKRLDAIGCVIPHAGYVYSGMVAGETFGVMEPKSVYIILGPNHTGFGSSFGMSQRPWKTPLGQAEIDEELAGEIADGTELVETDELSNMGEHSIEVELPFIQSLGIDFTFVPIVIGRADPKQYRIVAKAIAAAVKKLKLEDEVVIVASSDMTHYESSQSAREKDMAVIEPLLKLDEERFIRTVAEKKVSMCGYAPVFMMLIAAKELGAKRAALVDYRTSGDITGENDSVVGYAGIVVTRS